jgi:hypothetical protein
VKLTRSVKYGVFILSGSFDIGYNFGLHLIVGGIIANLNFPRGKSITQRAWSESLELEVSIFKQLGWLPGENPFFVITILKQVILFPFFLLVGNISY